MYNFCSCDIIQIYDKIVITSLLFVLYGKQNFLVAEEEKEWLGHSLENANTGFIDLRDKCYTSRKQNFITKIVNAPCKVFNFESLEEEYYFDELDEEMEKLPGYHILVSHFCYCMKCE